MMRGLVHPRNRTDGETRGQAGTKVEGLQLTSQPQYIIGKVIYHVHIKCPQSISPQESCCIEICAGQNLLEREQKETRSRLKKIFLFPTFFRFFSFLEQVFPLFPIFLWISNPIFRRSFPVFSSFHLSKPVPCFLMGLNLAI